MADMIKNDFLSYVKDFDKIQVLAAEIKTLTTRIKKMQEQFKAYPMFATSVTDHAAYKSLERLHQFGEEEAELMRDMVNTMDPSASLSLVPNIKTFILTVLAHAYVAENYRPQESKNNQGCTEYKYVFMIPKWRFGDRGIEMVAIVESNNVKTVFFNWKDKL